MTEQSKPPQQQTPLVRIAFTTQAEHGAILILTPEERKEALLQAARRKAVQVLADGDDNASAA